jgi:hypothetical protein
MTAWTIASAVVFGALLLVTAAAQPRGRFRWAQWLKRHDACA